MRRATAFIDGSGNSARVQACAVVIHVEDNPLQPSMIYKRSKLLSPHTTNNVGEYNGLLLALEFAAELQIDQLQIYSDSKLIVYQARGEWKCKNPVLIPLRNRARDLARIFHHVRIDWIPREENKEADRLCREAVKAHESSPNNPFLAVR
jgi:ribonuclease HI